MATDLQRSGASTAGAMPRVWGWLRQPGAAMLLLSGAILFVGLNQGDLRIDAPIYAWMAKHMVVSGDWLNLYYDHGQTPYFNKPPLQFWLMALAFEAFGFSTWAARLVSVLFAAGCVFLVYRLARGRFDPATAATAGIVLVTTYTFLRNSTTVRLDAGVTFFFLAALALGGRLLRPTPTCIRAWLGLGIVIGLGILAKSGAILLCLPVLIAAFAWQRRWDLVLNWRWLAALLVGVAIALPWYLQQYSTWGAAFIDEHFRRQQLDRFGSDTFGSSPWYSYFKELAMFYWPWFPLAAWGAWRIARAPGPRPPLERLFLAWALVVGVILQWITRKHDRYLLFWFPVLAIFAAVGLDASPVSRWWRQRVLPNLGWMAIVVFVGLEILGVRFHPTHLPEAKAAIPAMNAAPIPAGADHPVVWFHGQVNRSTQCLLRFLSNAELTPLPSAGESRLAPGAVLVVAAEDWTGFERGLPAHEVVARGKRLVFVRIIEPGSMRGGNRGVAL